MNVLVCGGRDFENYDLVEETLDEMLFNFPQVRTIIHGKARGADALADKWAKKRGIGVDPYYAEWHKYGNSAGPIRNQQMLDEGQPDLVVAFPGGNGTKDMVERARKAGIKVIEVSN